MDKQSKKYQKVRLIGEGTFGKAWLVKSHRSGRSYVTKEINLKQMKEEEKLQAANEVAILSRLKHNNVIRYREAFTSAGRLHIVMEYADRGDLAQRIEHRRRNSGFGFPEEQVLDWIVQICFALSYIHEQKILHRDLKPANIFLTSTNLVKIGDFGIAKTLTNTLDHARTAIGTPYYLSPEICRRKPYNQKSDIWAVGCILYEMVTLRHPFEAKDFSSLVMNILRGQYQSVPSEYSAIIVDVISVLLRVKPEKRPSAMQILQVPAMRHFVTLYTNRKHGESVTSSPRTHIAMSRQSVGCSEGTHQGKGRKRLNGISNDEIEKFQSEEVCKRGRARELIEGKDGFSKESQTRATKTLIGSNKTTGNHLRESCKIQEEKELANDGIVDMNAQSVLLRRKEKNDVALTTDKDGSSCESSSYRAPSYQQYKSRDDRNIPGKKTYILIKDSKLRQNAKFSYQRQRLEKRNAKYSSKNHLNGNSNEILSMTVNKPKQNTSKNCVEVGEECRNASNQRDVNTSNKADPNLASNLCEPAVSSPDPNQTMEIAEMMHAGTPTEGENTGSVRGRLESIRLYLEQRVGTSNCVEAFQCFAETNESNKVVIKMRDRIGSRNMRYFPMLLQAWDLENRYH